MPSASSWRSHLPAPLRAAAHAALGAAAEPWLRWRATRVRATRATAESPLRALILAPVTVGSLGDEAMVQASARHLRQRGFTRVTLACRGAGEPWPAGGDIDAVLDLGRDEPAGFPRRQWRELAVQARFLAACRDHSHFYVLGADMMDGFYSPRETLLKLALAERAAQAGLAASIIGFSFNPQPAPAVVRRFRRLSPRVRLGARDPISQSRLATAAARPVAGTADVAFLLDADPQAPGVASAREWIASQRARGRLVVGVSANYQTASAGRGDPLESLIGAYAQAIATIVDHPLAASVLLLAHDRRLMDGVIDDFSLAERVWERLPATARRHAVVVDRACGARAIKAIVADLDVVVAGRMHLVIASLGQGVPAAAITYQGKFEGLYSLFELDGLTLAPAQVRDGEALASLVTHLAARREEIRAQLAAHLGRVRELAARNFDL